MGMRQYYSLVVFDTQTEVELQMYTLLAPVKDEKNIFKITIVSYTKYTNCKSVL